MATFKQDKKTGRWSAQVFLGTGKGQRPKKRFDTKKDAEQWARGLEQRRDVGDVVQMPSRDTLGAVIDRYTADDGRWSADKTHHLKKLKDGLGHLPLAKLSHATIFDHVVGMKASPGNAASRLSYLSSVLTHAETAMHLVVRTSEFQLARRHLTKKKAIGRSKARTRRPTAEEIALIRDCSVNEDYRANDLPAVLDVLAVLPIRVGELCKITWDDFDHAKRTVTLRGRKHPDPAVKEANDETIPLLKIGKVDTYDLLVTARKRLSNQMGPFPYRVQALSNSMIKARTIAAADLSPRAAELLLDTNIHDLRAHAISTWLENGVDPFLVMYVSGHKDVKVFFKHYVRLDIEKVRAGIEAKMAA